MRKCSVLVASLLSLFLLFSFRGYAEPIWSNATNSTPPSYDPNYISKFNVTWTNANVTFITIYDFTNATNFLINNFSMSSTYGNGIYNYSAVLPAGTWNWTSYANDTSNNWTSTNITTISIGKGTIPIHLFLNGTEDNRVNLTGYKLNDTANFLVILDTSNIPYTLGGYTTYLNSNFTYWNVQNSSNYLINLNKTGLFNLTANWSGNENYSSSQSPTYLFTVTDLVWLTNITSVPSGSTYVSGKNYSFQISWTENVSKVLFDWNGNNSSYVNNNTGNIYWVNLTDLSAGNYNYSWYANDTNNFWSSSDTWNYNISPIQTTLSMTVSSTSATAGSSVTFSCYVTNNPIPSPGIQVTLSAGTCTGPNNFTSCSVTVPSVAGTYNYICSTNGNGNYAPASTSQYVIVSGTSPPPSPSSPGSNTPTGSFTIKVLTSSLAVLQGETKSVQFNLSNTYNTLQNVKISVSGIDPKWYTLSKTSLNLSRGGSETLTITFNIPSDALPNNYSVTIDASGKEILTNMTRSNSGTIKLIVNSSQPQPIQPMPSQNVTSSPESNVVENNTANITSNQTSVATGLVPAFEFFKNNLVIILAVAACLLIFIFRNNLTTALTGTLGKEETEARKAKTTSPLKGIKDKLNYKLVVNLKKESKAKNMKEPIKEVEAVENVPETIHEAKVPGKEPKRPAMLEKEIKRDIKELQGILDAEKKVGKNKKKFNLGNN